MATLTSQSYQRLYWTALLMAFAAVLAVIFSEDDKFYRDFERYFSGLQPSISGRATLPTRLTIDFGNGERRAFQGEVEDGMTILAALFASQTAGRFSVSTDSRGRVIDIAGIRAGGGRAWRVYLNDAPIQDLPGHTEIQPGDKILFRYE